jgi:hypothetical protein
MKNFGEVGELLKSAESEVRGAYETITAQRKSLMCRRVAGDLVSSYVNVYIASTQSAQVFHHEKLKRIGMKPLDIWNCRGLRITSPARTPVDCALLYPFKYALAFSTPCFTLDWPRSRMCLIVAKR